MLRELKWNSIINGRPASQLWNTKNKTKTRQPIIVLVAEQFMKRVGV